MKESLMDLILSPENMNAAWKQVKSNKGSAGVDNMSIDDFSDYMHKKWSKVKQALLLGYYVPSPVLKVEIPKKSGGKRILGIPTVLDRVIQQGISQILIPIFDPDFSDHSLDSDQIDQLTEQSNRLEAMFKRNISLL